MKPSPYLYSNNQTQAALRLRGLESIEDQATTSALDKLGSLKGLHCLEVGAGAGSIAKWLAHQVGPDGRVIATDLDPTHLDASQYVVWQHNLVQDSLPTEAFDLIHVRHLLIHLPDPATALKKLYRSTKTGGALLVEESDLRSWQPDEASPLALREQFSEGVHAVLNSYRCRSMDIALGDNLPTLLASAGFTVSGESRQTRTVTGGSEEARYQSLSAQLLMQSIERDALDLPAIEGLSTCLLDPRLTYQSRTTVAVSGTKPHAQ